MKHSSQMSLSAMFFGDRFCFSRKGWTGGGEWVHPKVQTAWPSLGSALQTHWLALGSPPMHKQTEKAVLSPCRAPISSREALFPVCTSGCWLRAMIIARLLMGGCGLSHEHVEDGCKSILVCSLGAENPTELGIR